MDRKRIATPSRTKDILKKYNFSFKKSLGQNFIVDPNILDNMVKESGITKESGVIEVGPGIGALTEQLALSAKRVVSYEVDERLHPILSDTLSPYENVTVLFEDILQADISSTIKKHFHDVRDLHVVANLPYYITTPIIFSLLEADLPITSITIMIQKEVAERMTATPGTKEYGALTIAVQYYTEPKKLMEVPKSVFMPEPKITSAVIKLTKRKQPRVEVIDDKYFFSMVKAAFRHRRKTLRNNLLSFFADRLSKEAVDFVLEEIGIDGRRRGESLTIEEFSKLANAFYEEEQTHK